MKPEPNWLTTQQVAERLGMSDARVRKLRIDGRIEAAKTVGGTWVYPPTVAEQGFTKRKAGRPKK